MTEADDDEERKPPSVLGRGESALRRVGDLAREVLREEGLSEEQIDALLERGQVRDEEP
ncbi:MAG: hypothetical protein ACT4OF_09995 [Caulobacteraceae bacterium]